jgi:hypothetical protein
LLAPPSSSIGHIASFVSHSSVVLAIPSLGQTVLFVFHTTDDEPDDEDTQLFRQSPAQANSLQNGKNGTDKPQSSRSTGQHLLLDSAWDITRIGLRTGYPYHCAAFWQWYFRQMARVAYYRALFHLLVPNFPYA